MFQLSPALTLHAAGGDAAGGAGDHAVPPQRDGQLPAHPRGHRPHQLVPAGARHRHRGAAAVQPRAQQRARSSSASTASTWTPSRTPSPPTAGSIRWWSSCPCWRWRCCWPTAASASARGALTLGVVVAFFQYGMRFFRPIQDLSEKYNILQSAMAASERIFKLLDTEPRIVAPAAPQPVPAAAAAHRVRRRLVRLQGRRLGAARRQLRHRAGRDRGRGGPHRRGQDHADQPAAALLRRADAAPSASAASTSASSTRATCAGTSASCCRTRYLFTGTIEENIRLGTRRHRPTKRWRRPPSR